MAIIEPGVLISGIRGKVGGAVFSATANGPYVKAWAKPSVRRSQAIIDSRGNLTTMGNRWAALTAGQRTAWDSAAANANRERTNALGQTYNMTGFQLYVSHVSAIIQDGGTPGATATTTDYPAQTAGLAITAAAPDTLDVEWTSPNYSSTQWITFYATVTGFPGRTAPPNRWRFLRRVNDTTAGTTVDLAPQFNAAFGPLIAGTTVWIRTLGWGNGTGLPQGPGPMAKALVTT